MRVYVIACQHGDEPFGLKIIGDLKLIQNENIQVRIAHPQALAKRKRYIESDLNRSFAAGLKTIEARLARLITQDIRDFSPDAILDIHTSSCEMQDVGIAASDTLFVRQVTSTLGIDTLVIMPPKFARHSLIGQFTDRALSLEFGKYHRSDKLAATIAMQISQLSKGKPLSDSPPAIFRVSDTIPKNYKDLAAISNLQENKQLGGYPFLAGADTYETIGGFLAIKDRSG